MLSHMRKIITRLILLISILSFAQKKVNWNEVTIKTLDSIQNELEPEQIECFNY